MTTDIWYVLFNVMGVVQDANVDEIVAELQERAVEALLKASTATFDECQAAW